MVLKGEVLSAGWCCNECKAVLVPQVLRSNAGYYIGSACYCGPCDRQSGYYKNREEAQKALDADSFYR